MNNILIEEFWAFFECYKFFRYYEMIFFCKASNKKIWNFLINMKFLRNWKIETHTCGWVIFCEKTLKAKKLRISNSVLNNFWWKEFFQRNISTLGVGLLTCLLLLELEWRRLELLLEEPSALEVLLDCCLLIAWLAPLVEPSSEPHTAWTAWAFTLPFNTIYHVCNNSSMLKDLDFWTSKLVFPQWHFS